MWTVIEQRGVEDQKFYGPMTYGAAMHKRDRLNRRGVGIVAVVKARRYSR